MQLNVNSQNYIAEIMDVSLVTAIYSYDTL